MKLFFITSLLFLQIINNYSQLIKYVELDKYFKDENVTGSISILNVNNNELITSDTVDLKTQYIPASTFKIINSLIALETGVAPDENFLLKWDGTKRNIPVWNKDTDMRNAFRNSTVWYYQEIARRIGEERMNEWITKTGYGNMNINGGIDRFWLDGELRISPLQQIEFISKLYKNELPFSLRSMETVKNVMARDTVNSHIIHAKTGWGNDELYDIGWFVGYTESNNNAYIFALNIRSPLNTDSNFTQKRIDITYNILKELGILTK